MLSEEQIKLIKEQIIKQIDTWNATDEQKNQAKEQIKSMNTEQLEDFLVKNKLIKQQGKEGTKTQEQSSSSTPSTTPHPSQTQTQQCPFCLITEDKIENYKIDENKTSIAVLEINPLSKGHSLIIPKKHSNIEKIPSQSFTLAKKISKKIKSKLKPREVTISTSDFNGHGIINIIPVYGEESGERKKADEKELLEVQEKLTASAKSSQRQNKTKKSSRKPKQLEKAPRRIP